MKKIVVIICLLFCVGYTFGAIVLIDDIAPKNAAFNVILDVNYIGNASSDTALTTTFAELNYVASVTSAIQTQLDARCLESVLGTSIGASLLLDGAVLKASAILQKYHGIDPSADVQSLLGAANDAAILADLTGTAGAAFSWNSQNLTSVGTIGCDAITSTGLTITNATVIGSDSVVFQPNSDSTTFLQVLDADGGNPILNIDSTNEKVGIGTVAPGEELEIQSSSPVLRLRDTGATANAATSFVEFGGTDAAAWSRTGYVGDASSGNTAICLRAEIGDLHLGDSSDAVAMILQGGNVGIGLTTVDANYKLIIRRAANINLGIGLQSSELAIAAFNDALSANIPMRLYASEFNLINGNVGIGVTDPSSKLEVNGTVGCGAITSTGLLGVSVAGNTAILQNTTDAASNQVAQFKAGNRATAANDDSGYLSLFCDDDGGTQSEIATLKWIIRDITAGGETGALDIQLSNSGALSSFLLLDSENSEAVLAQKLKAPAFYAKDLTSGFYLKIFADANQYSADRLLEIDLNDANRVVTFAYTPLIFDQPVSISASPTFAGLTLTGSLIISDGGNIGSASVPAAIQIQADGDILTSTSTRLGVRAAAIAYPLYVPWITGDAVATSLFGSANASNDQIAIVAYSSSGTGISATSSSGSALTGASGSGAGVWTTSDTGLAAKFVTYPTTVNDITTVGTFTRYYESVSTPANGIGGEIVFLAPNDLVTAEDVASIGWLFTDVSNGSEDSAFIISTRAAGAALVEQLRITNTVTTLAGALIAGSVTQIGDATNKMTVAADGEIGLEGTARVKKIFILNYHPNARTAGSGSYGDITRGHDFDPDTDEFVDFEGFVPLDIDSSANIVVKFDWCPTIANDLGALAYPLWRGFYKLRDIGEDLDGYDTVAFYQGDEIPDAESAGTLHTETFATIADAQPGESISVRIYREADEVGGGDTYEYDIMVLTNIFVEYTSNKLGEAL